MPTRPPIVSNWILQLTTPWHSLIECLALPFVLAEYYVQAEDDVLSLSLAVSVAGLMCLIAAVCVPLLSGWVTMKEWVFV